MKYLRPLFIITMVLSSAAPTLAKCPIVSSTICHFEGAQRFCEVHDPLAPEIQITENHIVHMAPYEQLDDYERGYVDAIQNRNRH